VCCHSAELTSGSLKGRRCITKDRRMQTVVLNDDVLSVMYVQIRVAPDMIFSNPAGAGFGIANPAGAGAECFLSCGPT